MKIENIINDGVGFCELVSSMGDDLQIVNSARVSYNRESNEFGDKDKRLIKYLLKNNHSSPLEHVQFTFLVEVPLFIERQWNRHRSWKYFSLNEISRRYSSENINFHVPKEFRKQHSDNKQMSTDELIDLEKSKEIQSVLKMFYEDSLQIYDMMLEHGVAREQAREVFPIALYTKFYATVDLHNLFWFLELRRHPHAQLEIRLYAEAIEQLIKNIVPYTYSVWNELMEEKYKNIKE